MKTSLSVNIMTKFYSFKENVGAMHLENFTFVTLFSWDNIHTTFLLLKYYILKIMWDKYFISQINFQYIYIYYNIKFMWDKYSISRIKFSRYWLHETPTWAIESGEMVVRLARCLRRKNDRNGNRRRSQNYCYVASSLDSPNIQNPSS